MRLSTSPTGTALVPQLADPEHFQIALMGPNSPSAMPEVVQLVSALSHAATM